MIETADFFLASTEDDGLLDPRRAYRLKGIGFAKRKDGLLIRVDPPLRASSFGGTGDFDTLIVLPRLEGESLFPISTWPIHVYVLRPRITDVLSRDHLAFEEAESIAWAALYRTRRSARLKVDSE